MEGTAVKALETIAIGLLGVLVNGNAGGDACRRSNADAVICVFRASLSCCCCQAAKHTEYPEWKLHYLGARPVDLYALSLKASGSADRSGV